MSNNYDYDIDPAQYAPEPTYGPQLPLEPPAAVPDIQLAAEQDPALAEQLRRRYRASPELPPVGPPPSRGLTAESGIRSVLGAAKDKLLGAGASAIQSAAETAAGAIGGAYGSTKQALADYVNGSNAVSSAELDRQLQATAAANPNAGTAEVVQKAITDPDVASTTGAGASGAGAATGYTAAAVPSLAASPVDFARARQDLERASTPATGQPTLNAHGEDPSRYVGKDSPISRPYQGSQQITYERPGPHSTVGGKLQTITGQKTITAGLPQELRGVRPDGSFRVPTGTDMRVPTGYDVIPSEDLSLGKIAVPTGTAIGSKDIVKYDAAGNPVPLRIPSVWDPTKVRYEGYGKEGSGRALYDRPPPGVAPTDPSTVGSFRLRGGTGFGAPGSGEAQYSDRQTATPYTSSYARGTASVPPSAGDNSIEAQGARLHPGTSEAQARAGYAGKGFAEEQKEAGRAKLEGVKSTARAEGAAALETQRQQGRVELNKARDEAHAARQQAWIDFRATKAAQDIASKTLSSRERQLVDVYDTAIRSGVRPPDDAVAAVKKLSAAVNAAGYYAPPLPGPRPNAAAPTIPPEAIEALRANPARRDEFDRYYGPGSAARALGG